MHLAFAIPGDIDTPTGGYRYDRHLMAELRRAGHTVDHLVLPSSFPAPGEGDRAMACRALETASARLLLVDGLAFGVLPAARIAALGRPVVALVHHPLALETGLSPERAAELAAAERAALSAAADVVVTSAPTRDTLVRDYGVSGLRVTVAEPGLDRSWHTHPSARRPADPPLVVSVGSVTARKAHHELVRALQRVADVPWQAMIVGRLDADPDALSVLRAAIGDSPRITLAGALSEGDIHDLYRRAHLFALATHYEGYGMVFLEAMASGLPIVATRGGAVASVVPPSAGLTVPVGDVDALAAALRRVLTDEALARRLSAGALDVAARAGDWGSTRARVEEALARVSGG